MLHRRSLSRFVCAFLAVSCLAACTSQPPASSSASISISTETASAAPSSVAPQSTSIPLEEQTIEPQPLELQDFLVCQDGRAVLNPADVTFWTFSFAHNAENNRLDAQTISTIRGLSLGDSVERIQQLYMDIPVDIYETTDETTSVLYEDYEAYEESGLATSTHRAVVSLYEIDGEVIHEPTLVQRALEENQFRQAHTIFRHDLELLVQDGHIADIVMTESDMSPYPTSHITAAQFTKEGQYTIGLYSLGVSATGLHLPVGVHNFLEEDVLVRCNYTLINGQATRNPGYFELSVPAGTYNEQTLLVLNEDIRPTGIESLESIGILLQFYSKNGQLLFESEGVEVPVFSNVNP